MATEATNPFELDVRIEVYEEEDLGLAGASGDCTDNGCDPKPNDLGEPQP